MYVDDPIKTFTSGATIAQYARVKLSSGNVIAAGANDEDLGTAESQVLTSGDLVDVRLSNAYGTRSMIASEAISLGAKVYGAASGKIADTPSERFIGKALEAATADGDIIEVLMDGGLDDRAAVFQPAQTAKTTSATLTAAEIRTGIITVNQGGGAASTLTLPLATAMDTEFDDFGVNDAFDFSVINISTVAAEDALLATNTGWTIVGNLDVASNAAATDKSAGRFRARKTATGAWTLYRLS